MRSVLTNFASLDSCQKDNSFCGVLSLFTVFHLPRATHIELFMNIKRYTPLTIASLYECARFAATSEFADLSSHDDGACVARRIMKSGAPLLISVPEEAGEGTSNNWLGGSTMYWSALHTHTRTHTQFTARVLTTRTTCAHGLTVCGVCGCIVGHFSVEWYELTLKQLGFELIIKYKDVREFLGEEEVMYYLLFKVSILPILHPPTHTSRLLSASYFFPIV